MADNHRIFQMVSLDIGIERFDNGRQDFTLGIGPGWASRKARYIENMETILAFEMRDRIGPNFARTT